MSKPSRRQLEIVPRPNWFRRLLRWGLLDHLEAIDRQTLRPDATSDRNLLISLYTSCSVIFLLNYVVLDGQIQRAVATWLLESLSLGRRVGDEIHREDLRLTMRITWTLGCSFLYLVVPSAIHVWVLKRPFRELGLVAGGFLRHLWIYLLLFIPVLGSVVVVSFDPSFQNTYPFYHEPGSVPRLIAWELFYGLQFLSLEVFFRGFMLSEFKYRLGWRSAFIMIIPYCMIHFTKPWPEALGSILAGTVLAFLALRTGSILGGVFIHVAVAWSMDIASLYQRGWFADRF